MSFGISIPLRSRRAWQHGSREMVGSVSDVRKVSGGSARTLDTMGSQGKAFHPISKRTLETLGWG